MVSYDSATNKPPLSSRVVGFLDVTVLSTHCVSNYSVHCQHTVNARSLFHCFSVHTTRHVHAEFNAGVTLITDLGVSLE